MKIKVLWIDPDVCSSLRMLTGHVYADGGYELSCVKNATDAVQKISENEYDIVIFNTMIDPGLDDNWIKIYSESWKNGRTTCLGLQLLYSLLQPEKEETKFLFPNIPSWIHPNKIGILTTEPVRTIKKFEKHLRILGIDPKIAYIELEITMPATILLDLIRRISKRNSI